jgi:hypothetical protein
MRSYVRSVAGRQVPANPTTRTCGENSYPTNRKYPLVITTPQRYTRATTSCRSGSRLTGIALLVLPTLCRSLQRYMLLINIPPNPEPGFSPTTKICKSINAVDIVRDGDQNDPSAS